MTNFRPLFSVLALGFITSVASAAPTWQGVLIMPKTARTEIQDDNGSSVSMYNIAWPAVVQRTKGRFLWIQDEGGYSRNQAGGWVYADDVVRLDEAGQHFSDQLRTTETAWLYWMRGISWEAKNEPGIAILDYQNALHVSPQTTLDDVHIRLGRLLAQQQLQGGRGKYDDATEKRNEWNDQFKNAQSINPTRPQLYYEWGIALGQACACTQKRLLKSLPAGTAESSAAQTAKSGESKDALDGPTPVGASAADQALHCYELAEQYNPRWWRIPLARGELLLNQCDEESPEGERVVIQNVRPDFFAQILTHCKRKNDAANGTLLADNGQPEMVARGAAPSADSNTKNNSASDKEQAIVIPTYMRDVLLAAMDDYNRAINLYPNALDAYRDRGEVLRLLGRLDDAQTSANTACKLCDYRQAGSLRTLAQVYFDQGLFEPAADYALRAAELASVDGQKRLLLFWNKCGRHCSGDQQSIAVALAESGIASRGANDNDNDARKLKPPQIEPPPGFISRSANAVPE